MSQASDCLVIGGGPAGSTTAIMLAKRGYRVRLLDKARHPRYHIGESLIPYCHYTLERLGLAERMAKSAHIKKFSVQFVGTSGVGTRPFYFFEHLFDRSAVTWQVWRHDFDKMMIEHARAHGVEVCEDEAAEKLLLDDSGRVVGAATKTNAGVVQERRARITVDATGRDALSASQFGWRVLDEGLARFALWTYFKGAVRDAGIDAGATTVAAIPEGGWFWWIPLSDNITSVGVVARRDYLFRDHHGVDARKPEALADIFQREVKANPWIEQHLRGSERCDEYRLTHEYSYRSRHCSRDGLVLVGDALSFIDPIFSSGVFLALRTGELAADAIDKGLRANDVSAGQFAPYAERVLGGVNAMRKLVYAFYSPRFTFSCMIKKDPAHRADIADLLIGNFFRDYEPFFKQVAEFADLPQTAYASTPFVASSPVLS